MEAHSTPYDIFLSHSGNQKGFVIDLHNELSSMGYSVFFDQDDESLPRGQPFPPLIFSAAKNSKIGIVVLSDDFLTSYWPMLELCVFAKRLQHDPDSFTLLPLFYELSPEDIKRKNKLEGWIAMWMEFERVHGPDRITAAKCKEAVMKYLAPRNGIVHGGPREGQVSYIEEVANKIKLILPCRATFTDTGKPYSGRQRLCQVSIMNHLLLHSRLDDGPYEICSIQEILDEFRKLEAVHPLSSNLHGHVLGMYGVPGSGKSTLCKFLCDHDAMIHEFRENVIYVDLPTNFEPQHRAEDYRELIRHYSKLIPGRKHLASTDLTQIKQQLRNARITRKMFLVLDNIAIFNLETYRTMVCDILSSAILLSGSKIMLVAQSEAFLEGLMFEVERHSTYKHAIVEVPRMIEEEAIEIIRRNCCHSYTGDDAMSLPFLRRIIPSSSLYIPFVLEQIGVLLRNYYTNNGRETRPDLEMCLEIVSEGKKDAVLKLVDVNFKMMPPDLQVLFLDIALFIIPASYTRIDEAALFLGPMNGTTARSIMIKIQELPKHCALSIKMGTLQIHDIFLEYAKNMNFPSYVNATWASLIRVACSSFGLSNKVRPEVFGS